MKILAGTICRVDPETLEAHLKTVKWQQLDDGISVDYVYIDDNVDPQSTKLLREEVETLTAGPRPVEAGYEVTETTHKWRVATFDFLAQEKQRLLEKAVEERYDAIWLVDADLLCDPGTLQSLIDADKQIVSAVFWTKWQPELPALPQVWLKHPYELSGRGKTRFEFLSELSERQLVPVYGLGACTLARVEALEHARFFPRLSELPSGGMWQGEDRSFCIRAERAHIGMAADAWPDIWHCYRPSDREHLDDVVSKLQALRSHAPLYGDLVSIGIRPLEEPGLSQHQEIVRGRLGQLKLLPEIEAALLEMKPRDSRIVTATYSPYLPSQKMLTRKGYIDVGEKLRGQTKRFYVTLQATRAYEPHPTESDEWMQLKSFSEKSQEQEMELV